MKKFDYLIVGCGLFGATFAQKALEKNKKVLIVDKRSHVGGNIYTKNIKGINVHQYGPHIFHTNKQEVWNYLNKFVKFNDYKHKGIVNYKNKIYSFPINLMTISQIWGITSPKEAKEKIEKDKIIFKNPKNMEEWCLSNIGKTLYEIFIKGYSKKQWNTDPKNLPACIVKRLPIRMNFNDDYFHDSLYQGIPIGGYTLMIENMLDNVKVELESDFNKIKNKWRNYAKNLVYTGGIDDFYNYEFGDLEYRSLRWEHNEQKGDFQGHSCVNYTDENIPFTRIIEHKHFEKKKKQKKNINKKK